MENNLEKFYKQGLEEKEHDHSHEDENPMVNMVNEKTQVNLHFPDSFVKFAKLQDIYKAITDGLGKIKFPDVMNVKGRVDVEFPKTQEVTITNPVKKVEVEFPDTQKISGEVEVKDIEKLSKLFKQLINLTSDVAKQEKKQVGPMKVEVQNWQHLAEQAVSAGGSKSLDSDQQWIREKFTYTTISGNRVPIKVEKWSSKYKLTEDFEYEVVDVSGTATVSPVIKSRAREPLTTVGA